MRLGDVVMTWRNGAKGEDAAGCENWRESGALQALSLDCQGGAGYLHIETSAEDAMLWRIYPDRTIADLDCVPLGFIAIVKRITMVRDGRAYVECALVPTSEHKAGPEHGVKVPADTGRDTEQERLRELGRELLEQDKAFKRERGEAGPSADCQFRAGGGSMMAPLFEADIHVNGSVTIKVYSGRTSLDTLQSYRLDSVQAKALAEVIILGPSARRYMDAAEVRASEEGA